MASSIPVVATGAVVVVSLGLYLIRRWRSSKWGKLAEVLRHVKLVGKVVVVTGGNTGLGAEVVKDAAGRGATVVIAARNELSAYDTITRARKETGNKNIHFLRLDLSSLESVREFAKEFSTSFSQLDYLVLNAGVWVPMEKKYKTKDEFEIHAGVNHLGHFLLVHQLCDNLLASVPSRVVVVSSGLMNMGILDLSKYDHFREGRVLSEQEKEGDKKRRNFAPTGYTDSKLMNALFGKSLSDRIPGVTVVTVCPGFCYTQLHRYTDIPTYKKVLLAPILMTVMRSAARGAENIVSAMLDEGVVSGGFYRECQLVEKENKMIADMGETAKQLWETSESLTSIRY